ncbi:MAG: aldehyde ferredoxin oxidoreductase family protein [Caldiserica bacterium]|nr:aldehyde ferredoxin oxidoreductase family protein [Caldisericota bacterium]
MKPYCGRILWVNLTTGTFATEELPESFYRMYLSGLGLAASLLYQHIPAGTDPLGPDNILAFVSGLLTGSGSLFTGRWMAAAKSPLTGTWGDANCGGTLSPAIKQCGYDGIFVSGASDHPVYLYVDNHGPQLRGAADLWGKDTIETEELLKKSGGGREPSVACIGPAGERLSLIAGISNDGGRMAARSGLGAVMGSKKLKAVVLAGSRPMGSESPQEMMRLSLPCAHIATHGIPLPSGRVMPLLGALLRHLPATVRMDGRLSVPIFRKWGTCGMDQASVEWGDTPVRNWSGSERDYHRQLSDAIDPDRVLAREQRKYHCYSCPLGCGGVCEWQGRETHRPEYETIGAFSALLMCNDLDTIYAVNDQLNRAGMDTISAGGTIAWAMEAWEKGVITPADTDGLALHWGDPAVVRRLVELMIAREGIGALLADGSLRAARHFGHDSESFAIQAGGQEIAMHDPRLDPGYALHASVEPTPGRHTTGCQVYYDMYHLWTRVPGLPTPLPVSTKAGKYRADATQAAIGVANSCFTQLFNGVGLCMFGAMMGVDHIPVFEWLNAATGWHMTPEEYMETGRRIQTIRQLFNVREGIDASSLAISSRAAGHPPLEHGANRGRSVPLVALMHDYWGRMGWDPGTGTPTAQTLQQLGIQPDTAVGDVPASV